MGEQAEDGRFKHSCDCLYENVSCVSVPRIQAEQRVACWLLRRCIRGRRVLVAEDLQAKIHEDLSRSKPEALDGGYKASK